MSSKITANFISLSQLAHLNFFARLVIKIAAAGGIPSWVHYEATKVDVKFI